jgi:hypothetical protein
MAGGLTLRTGKIARNRLGILTPPLPYYGADSVPMGCMCSPVGDHDRFSTGAVVRL